MTLLDLCVSAKLGHCGCMKRSRVVSQTSTFLYTGLNEHNIQIQPGLKAKLWLIIRVNKKKLNRVMLKGDDNENGFKTNRSNQQKIKLHVQHTFSSNQQKTNFHVQHAFLSFPCRCFARLQRCFVRLKRQTSQLHIIFMCAYPIFCFLCSCSLFFTAAPFHLAGRQHVSFSHRRFEFPCFSSYEIRLLCFQ